MKVVYYNDRDKAHRVFVNGLHWENSVLLEPHECKVIEFNAPEGAVPEIKEWNNQTMVTWTKEESFNGQVETVYRT